MGRGRVRVLASVLMSLGLPVLSVACVPDQQAATLLDVDTQLTWCGGVVPPPGEPWCHTSSRSTPVEVRSGREVIASGTTGADGHLVVAVPAGDLLTIVAVAAPPYEDCDHPTVVAAAGITTPVVQTCTVYAP